MDPRKHLSTQTALMTWPRTLPLLKLRFNGQSTPCCGLHLPTGGYLSLQRKKQWCREQQDAAFKAAAVGQSGERHQPWHKSSTSSSTTCQLCPSVLLRHPVTHGINSHGINSKISKERASKKDQIHLLLLTGKIFVFKKKKSKHLKLGFIVLETHKNSAKWSGV